MRKSALIVCALAAAGVLAPAASTATAPAPAPRYANPIAAARPLVVRYFRLVQQKDVAGLERFLSPAFQVQRADGTASEKADYLKKLPDVQKFSLSKFRATQEGGTLVVRYLAVVTGSVNGKPYRPGPAPRLTVFAWNGQRWLLAAHSNFNPLNG